jgi:hypothetical protein
VRLRQRYILGAIMFGSRKPLAVRLSGCEQPCWNETAGLRAVRQRLDPPGAWRHRDMEQLR